MENLKNLLSTGNKKLPKTTAIFNITSATDCPSKKLGLCQLCNVKDCYAMKSERQYPNVLPYRRRQEGKFDNVTAEDFVKEFKAMNDKKRNKVDALRISEAGDMRSQKDFNKVNRIAELLKEDKVKVYIYTARKDLSFAGKSENLAVNGSGFKRDGINTFKAVKEYSKNSLRCVGDCKKCNLCTKTHNKTIEVLMH